MTNEAWEYQQNPVLLMENHLFRIHKAIPIRLFVKFELDLLTLSSQVNTSFLNFVFQFYSWASRHSRFRPSNWLETPAIGDT
jgi:hypothetical protein